MRHRARIAGLALAAAAACESSPSVSSPKNPPTTVVESAAPKPKPKPAPSLAPFAEKGLDWLVEAQQPSGGFGGGSNSAQQIRDPHAVPADPGTSALATMAFLRAGHTPTSGRHRESVLRAVGFLLGVVEESKEEGPAITSLEGTQPQAKMGRYVDTALCAQLFTRLLPDVASNAKLSARVRGALDKCLRKIERSQSQDGSWGGGGWAPVLQSSLMCNALEMAQSMGRSVDQSVLDRAKSYQKAQVDAPSGAVSGGASAGVALYAASGNFRAVANDSKVAIDVVEEGKRSGKLSPADSVSEESLRKAGLDSEKARDLALSHRLDEAARKRIEDEQVLAGFGSNGGEEFLSYLMTSESLVVRGGDDWNAWSRKISDRLAKVQNGDGSWSGHHCITSPVFCTSAVLLTLAVERDVDAIASAAKLAAR